MRIGDAVTASESRCDAAAELQLGLLMDFVSARLGDFQAFADGQAEDFERFLEDCQASFSFRIRDFVSPSVAS